MIRIYFILLTGIIFLLSNTIQDKKKEFLWPGGRKVAISLSYDDALNSQLDNALPELNKYNFKASFYILPNSPVMKQRLNEWRSVAGHGHELGNHSIYHPCSGSLPDRDWLPKHHDLDLYSIDQMIEEITTANTFLKAVDGKTERTYTPPCGDSLAGGENYLNRIRNQFVAIKGFEIEKGFAVLWSPTGVTGKELIDYVKNIPTGIKLINIVFHGVGGDYLSVSSEAHAELLSYLAENQDRYYVDSYIRIMKYVHDSC